MTLPTRSAVLCALAAALAALPLARAQEPSTPVAPPPAVAGMATITEEELGNHVRMLAADEMKGRDARSGGIEIAADYVRGQMKAIGLTPAGDGADYFQTFTVGRAVPDPQGHTFTFRDATVPSTAGWLTMGPCNGSWTGRLVHGGDGSDAAWAELKDPAVVKGAFVVVSTGRQIFERDTFEWLPKLAERAGDLGAVGVIHVPQNDQGPRRWAAISRMISRPRPASQEDIKTPAKPVAVWMERSALDALLGAIAAADLLRAPLFRGPTETAPGDDVVTLQTATTLEGAVTYKNICGVVPGTDPTLAAEYVAFSAHYDHIGMRPLGPDIDGIFNGADDDASGVAAILEMAQAFAGAPGKRSVLVIAFTAEEQGLLGSKHFAAHPTIPLAQIVCDFNCEMLGRPAAGGLGYLWITGYERSSLGSIVAEAGRPHGLVAEADPYAEMGFFGRSDNYSLAQHGIPAHSFSSFNAVQSTHYHKPSDHADQCNFANMQMLVRGIYAGARRVADGAVTPTWTAGDPLGRIRGK